MALLSSVLGASLPISSSSFSADSSILLAAYQTVPPAPGRESGTGTIQPSAPATEPTQSAPPSAFGGGLLPILIFLVPMVLLLWFNSRSQQKRQAAALAAIKKGDRVLTQGGLVGRVVEMGDRFAKLEVAPGVKVEVLRSNVLGVDTPETQATATEKK